MDDALQAWRRGDGPRPGGAMSVIDRLKAKAQEARQIAPKAIANLESDLDSIISEGPRLEEKRAEAVGKHQSLISNVKTELEGISAAVDILSNDPLPESGSN